jgi:hypothetical protein
VDVERRPKMNKEAAVPFRAYALAFSSSQVRHFALRQERREKLPVIKLREVEFVANVISCEGYRPVV